MDMELAGSCHCKAVTFTVRSSEPVPFNQCYCEVCRKTAGAGGFAVNIGADFRTLDVVGRENIRIYRARIRQAGSDDLIESPAERSFCTLCGSALWPDQIHPHASAIDTKLPTPPMRWHMMLASKASWVSPCLRPGDREFEGYPDESLADWHRRETPS